MKKVSLAPTNSVHVYQEETAMVIGLYAPVGSGKSTALNFFKELGWTIIDQDVLAHEVLNENTKKIAALFGEEIIENNIISRKKLGSLVFKQKEKLQILEDFLYPIILKKTLALIKGNTVIEGANLYKVIQQYPINKTLTITVPLPLLKQRLLARGHDIQWINNVLSAQEDLFSIQKKADHILDNSGTLNHLKKQIEKLTQMFL